MAKLLIEENEQVAMLLDPEKHNLKCICQSKWICDINFGTYFKLKSISYGKYV